MTADILSYGAAGDGKTLNTGSIQHAIDDCARSGGGTVLVPPGVFVTGTVFLKSHVHLSLSAGAVLLGSPDPDDYCADDAYAQNWGCPQEGWRGAHVLAAVDQEDVQISGPGTIDGNCETFLVQEPEKHDWLGGLVWARGYRSTDHAKYAFRPGQMLAFVQCRSVRISGVNLRNSPCWSCFLHGCRDVIVRGLVIDNPVSCANSDGIDVDSCSGVTISDCIISTGDDAITLRASGKHLLNHPAVCEDIAIANCVLASSACAFRIGVGEGLIRNAVISNIAIRHAGRAVLLQSSFLRSGSGVTIENVSFSNVQARHTGYPLLILAGEQNTGKAQIRNICVSQFHAECSGGIEIVGNSVNRPDHIRLNDCSFEVVKFEYPCRPEKAPAYFLHCEHAGHVTLCNTELRWTDPGPEWRQCSFIQDTDELRKINCNLPEL